MTEQELRQSVLDKAKAWLTCKEADGSHRPIIDTYNQIRPLPRGYRMTYTDPWCATYVSAVGYAAGLSDIIFPECGCGPMLELYRKAGRWMEDDSYMPQAGDIVFYDWQDSGTGDNRGQPDHVGIVWMAYGDDITVIEGNKSDCVSFRQIKRNGKYVRGYGLPDYASKADAAKEEDPSTAPGGSAQDDTSSAADAAPSPQGEGYCSVELPVLSFDDVGEAVRAAQILLEKRGFKCGFMGADGEFGPKTEAALGKFKVAYDLSRTPDVDAEAWTVLILGVKK